jgi:hypothetical protein
MTFGSVLPRLKVWNGLLYADLVPKLITASSDRN